jgi:hypothetical protein
MTRPAALQAMDKKSLDRSPLRRAFRARWPRFDAAVTALGLWFLRAIGLLAALFGALILAGQILQG